MAIPTVLAMEPGAGRPDTGTIGGQPVAGLTAEVQLQHHLDYDRLAQERLQGEGPRVFDDLRGRRIAFQVWG